MFAVLLAANFLLQAKGEPDQLGDHREQRRLVDLARRSDDPALLDQLKLLSARRADLLQIVGELHVLCGENRFIEPAERVKVGFAAMHHPHADAAAANVDPPEEIKKTDLEVAALWLNPRAAAGDLRV